MKRNMMRLEMKTFPAMREMKGISKKTMETLNDQYRAHLGKTNEILHLLERADRAAAHPIYSELRSLKTELPVALAAVKSYELFFSMLGGHGKRPEGRLGDAIREEFGSYQSFLEELIATAYASRGWVALAFDLDTRRLSCVLGDTAEKLSVWNLAPVIVLEVSSHASNVDHPDDRIRYIHALLDNLDWTVAEQSFEKMSTVFPMKQPV